MTHRESVYECTFTLAGEPQRLLARAWDAQGARELVMAELRSEGLSAPRDLRVRLSAGPSVHEPPAVSP